MSERVQPSLFISGSSICDCPLVEREHLSAATIVNTFLHKQLTLITFLDYYYETSVWLKTHFVVLGHL